jgi:hypothetical protein
MNIRHLFASSLILLLSTGALIAQEQLGMRLGSYSGVHGLALNPANASTRGAGLTLHLGSGFFFAANNYFYWQNTSTPELLGVSSNNVRFISAPRWEGEAYPPNALVADYYDDGRARYGALMAGIEGPGAMLRLESGHSFGFSTRLRVAAGGRNLPTVFSYYPYTNRPLFETFPVPRFSMALVSWSEVALHYNYSYLTNTGRASVGVSLRYLVPLEGAFFENRAPMDYTKLPNDTISGRPADLGYGFTSSNLGSPYRLQGNGWGFGFDLGFHQVFEGYEGEDRWQFGMALIDLGYLNYTQNADVRRVLANSEVKLPGENYNFISSPEDFPQVVEQFNEDLIGNPDGTRKSDRMGLWLPTGISLQAAFQPAPGWFIHAVLIQDIPSSALRTPRGDLLAIVPRFEHRWLEVAMPFSLYNYSRPQLGFSARLGVLTLGSDRILSWVRRPVYSGTDFYLALRVPLAGEAFEVYAKRGGRRSGRVRCYGF